MSEKYIKRTKKGKGKQKKELKKELLKSVKELDVRLNKVVGISLALMVMREINDKEEMD